MFDSTLHQFLLTLNKIVYECSTYCVTVVTYLHFHGYETKNTGLPSKFFDYLSVLEATLTLWVILKKKPYE